MDLSIFISMLFCLQLFYWFVGQRASKTIDGQEDYFLAGKNVAFFPLMMTFLATQVGGGVILGAAEEAYKFGWPVLLYPLGASLGLILLGCGVGRKIAEFRLSTIAQLFEVVYQSQFLRKVASSLSVIALFMILVAQIIASSKFLVSLGFDNTLLFIAFWAIVIVYTTQGGLRAVISTDIVQALFFSVVFLVCFGVILFFEPTAALVEMPQTEDFLNVSSKLCGWLMMPLLFMVIEQDMGQRCFAGESPKVVSRSAFLAGVCTMLICVIPVFLGSLARITGIEVPQGGSVLMAIITKTTNPWMASLVGCAVLAAVISTATSLINAISSNISSDFNLSLFKKMDSMFAVKSVTCLISCSAIFFAFYSDSIVDLLILSYDLSLSCLFVPVAMALYRKRGDFGEALGAIVLGAAGFVWFRIFPTEFPREIISILLSAVGFILGGFLVNPYREISSEGVSYS